MDDTVRDALFTAIYAFDEFRLDVRRARLSRDGVEIPLTPKAFTVLECLVRSAGRVVDKRTLFAAAWPDVVVEESNLSQTIYVLRRALGEQPTDHRFIVTVPGRGYRFVADVRRVQDAVADPNPAPGIDAIHAVPDGVRPIARIDGGALAANEPMTAEPAPTSAAPSPEAKAIAAPPAVSRRRLLAGVGAALVLGTGAAGIGAWRFRTRRDDGAALAQRLIAKAREASLGSEHQGNTQAIAFLRRATELDPSSSEAWGDLALAYQQRLDLSMSAELPSLAEWSRAAATRALALDPACASAKIAIATIPSNFRHWAANERALRVLQGSIAAHPALETALGWLLCDVGRWTEAIACFRRALALEPFHPKNQLILAWAVWGAGQLEEADRLIENALRLWPQNRSIWQSRFDFLALQGRPAKALALVDDDGALPVVSPEQDPPPRAALRSLALALQSGAPADLDRAADEVVAARSSLGTFTVVPYLCALGRVDRAFAQLERYFFGGEGVPPPTPLSRRKTAILFLARSAPLRGDARFVEVTRRIGLDDYWRETGTRPDTGLVAARNA